MKCRMFALSLALGALLCLAPSAAALEPQPEASAPDTAAASQTDTPAGQALTEEVKRKEDNFVHCKLNANEGRRTQ